MLASGTSVVQSWKHFTKEKISSLTSFTQFRIFQHASSSLPLERKKNSDIYKKLLCVSYCIVMKCNWSILSSNQSTKKEGMERKHTSTSAEPGEPAEPALVKAPNLSFLFFSFSSSSIWKKTKSFNTKWRL